MVRQPNHHEVATISADFGGDDRAGSRKHQRSQHR
jgi:hypothetical protein